MPTISRQLGTNPMSFGQMWRENQFKTTIPIPPHSKQLQGKRAIITGANSGLGLECAKQMLGAGLSYLILAVRSPKKGEDAANQLRSLAKTASIDVWTVDMEDYQSVQNFAHRCETLDRIDYVVLNAGISGMKFATAKTGHEMMIQVNYLSTVLLAVLLLPVLKSKGQSHLTVVSSATTRQQKFPNQDVRPLLSSFDDTSITPFDNTRYSMSKLLGQMAFERIAGYVDPKDVIITLVEPGWVKQTGLYNDLPFVVKHILGLIIAICGRPVDQGAATYFDALCNQGEASHGSYIMNCKPAPYGDFVYLKQAEQTAEALWNETMDELEFVHARTILESMKTDKA